MDQISNSKIQRKKIFFIFYLLLSLLLIADLMVMQKLRISLAGYWSDRLLFWLWAFGTLTCLIVFWKSVFTKIYLALLIAGVVLSILPMMLPFWAITLAVTGLERGDWVNPPEGKYRMQIIKSVMSKPQLQIIENMGLFEKIKATSDTEFLRNNDLKLGYEMLKDIKLIQETPDSLKLEISTPLRIHQINLKKMR